MVIIRIVVYIIDFKTESSDPTAYSTWYVLIKHMFYIHLPLFIDFFSQNLEIFDTNDNDNRMMLLR